MNDNNDNTKDGRVEKRMGNTVEVCFFYNLFSLIKKYTEMVSSQTFFSKFVS